MDLLMLLNIWRAYGIIGQNEDFIENKFILNT